MRVACSTRIVESCLLCKLVQLFFSITFHRLLQQKIRPLEIIESVLPAFFSAVMVTPLDQLKEQKFSNVEADFDDFAGLHDVVPVCQFDHSF